MARPTYNREVDGGGSVGIVEELYTQIRKDEIDDILCLLKDRSWFLAYEARNRYRVCVGFKDTISLIDTEVYRRIKDYKKQYGYRIPLIILRRYVRG